MEAGFGESIPLACQDWANTKAAYRFVCTAMTRRCRLLAKGKTATARAWVYVRDDAPFGGPDPPAALFRYSRDRSGDHPVEHLRTFTGIFQADIYAGYNRLYAAGRSPGPVTEAACWSHCRRKFFELADIAASKGRGKNAPPISPPWPSRTRMGRSALAWIWWYELGYPPATDRQEKGAWVRFGLGHEAAAVPQHGHLAGCACVPPPFTPA